MQTKLFVIKQRGRELYWTCSSEHGSGWNEGHPKQSFSPSELTRELRRMIDADHLPDVEVCELRMTSDNDCNAKCGEPMQASPRCPTCGRR